MTNYDDYVPGGGTTAVDDDTDTTPAPAPSRVVRRGWGNAQKQKEASSPWPQELKPDEVGVAVKFLEDGPYATYRQHWIQEIQEGSKAFTCLDGIHPDGCPLCDGGSRASARFHFNVAQIFKGDDMPAQLRTYNIGITVFDQLSEFHTTPETGPLEKHYWVIKRKKNGNKWVTTPFMQREEELRANGWNVPAQAELDAMKLWGPDQVRIPKREDLVEIAAQYLDLE